jgi:general transcription factor 3C polypeptide 5 (transcription factor C subunit 1)
VLPVLSHGSLRTGTQVAWPRTVARRESAAGPRRAEELPRAAERRDMASSPEASEGDRTDHLAPEHPLPSATAVSVEYPGFVRDTDACLETLGAARGELQRALDSKAQSLQLRMRPDSTVSRPIYGDGVASTNLLLRVRRPKQTHARRQALPEPEPEYEATVVGVVTQTYRFDAMADFQYLGDVSKRRGHTTEAELGQLIEQLITDDDAAAAAAGNAAEPLNLAPSVFSKIDSPRDYAFKPNPNAKSMMRMAAAATSGPEGGQDVSRRRRPTGSENSVGRRTGSRATLEASLRNVAVDYLQGQDIMREPPAGVVGDPKDERQQKLQELFDERPIWSRLALSARLPEILPAALKRFLPCVGFYFVNGPWRLLWCRYGYDPNSDSASRNYQVIDFRMPRSVTRARTKNPSAAAAAAAAMKPEQQEGISASQSAADASANPAASGAGTDQTQQRGGSSAAKNVKKPTHTFECIPEQGQTFYQLCDLRDPDMALVVNKSPISAECDVKLGWYTKEALLQLRRLMKRKLQGFLVEAGIQTNIDGYVKATGKLDTEWIQMTAAAAAAPTTATPPASEAPKEATVAAQPLAASSNTATDTADAAKGKGQDEEGQQPLSDEVNSAGVSAAEVSSRTAAESSADQYKDDDDDDEDDESDDDDDDDESADDDDDDDDDVGQQLAGGTSTAAAAAAATSTAADSLSAFEEFAIFGDDSD